MVGHAGGCGGSVMKAVRLNPSITRTVLNLCKVTSIKTVYCSGNAQVRRRAQSSTFGPFSGKIEGLD